MFCNELNDNLANCLALVNFAAITLLAKQSAMKVAGNPIHDLIYGLLYGYQRQRHHRRKLKR